MESIVVAGLICGTVLYVAKLFLPVVQQHAATLANAPTKSTLEIPNDLLLAASKWHDSWAREQAIQRIQELYESTGDWDRVRYVYSQQDVGPDDS